MHQDETSDTQSNAPEDRKARSESLRDKFVTTLLGFILTGAIGTMVATWFQQRGSGRFYRLGPLKTLSCFSQ